MTLVELRTGLSHFPIYYYRGPSVSCVLSLIYSLGPNYSIPNLLHLHRLLDLPHSHRLLHYPSVPICPHSLIANPPSFPLFNFPMQIHSHTFSHFSRATHSHRVIHSLPQKTLSVDPHSSRTHPHTHHQTEPLLNHIHPASTHSIIHL